MIDYVPVEEVDIQQIVEYMDGKWAESSYSESGMWNFDMDYAKQFLEKMLEATPGPHGMVATEYGLVVGVLIGVTDRTWAESRYPAFQNVFYNADNGCGVQLMKEVEKILPKHTRFMLAVQMGTAAKFERVADKLGFVEMNRVFVKEIE